MRVQPSGAQAAHPTIPDCLPRPFPWGVRSWDSLGQRLFPRPLGSSASGQAPRVAEGGWGGERTEKAAGPLSLLRLHPYFSASVGHSGIQVPEEKFYTDRVLNNFNFISIYYLYISVTFPCVYNVF